ncbi:hypothetical protein KP509_06G085400 [Ceratopteris richardii]|nr:hypothetical protein KP509_06G085400 [Ceratopteris richardii]
MATTYGRFFKVIKARFDYSMVVFSLTFCLVSVAGYRGSDNVKVALDRMLIVLLGCMVCIVVSLFVFPVWAGDDLHNLIVNNFDDLAESIEGCTAAYFHSYDKKAHVQTSANDTISKGYMAVLLSKQTEENLVKQARFEPWHGRFGCMYPWQKCIQVGTILRNCAYIVCALHGCVLSEIQAPENLKDAFSQPCIHISSEVARVLREIAIGLRSCCKSQRSKQSMLHSLHLSVLRLHTALGAYNNQIAHIYNMTSSVVNSHKNGDVEVHINAACDVSAATLSTGGSAIPGTRIHQPHQFKRLFSNSLLHLPYCSSDIYHSHSASIDVIADKNLLKQCQEFTECFSVTTVAALLIEIVSRLEPLLKAVAELEEQACFKDVDEPVSSWIRRPNLKHLKTEKIVMQHGMAQIHAM